MHPSATGYLRELRSLADELFDVVRQEFTTGDPVQVTFDNVEDLVEQPIEAQHLVAATLLCAQLLHRVTVEPGYTQPRHVQTLTDILEQVIPPLARSHPRASPTVEAHLDALSERFARAASQLIVLADPGAVAYDARER